jgi:hypothetical protein
MEAPGPDPRDIAIANVVIGAFVLGGAWMVLRSPVARRLAWRGATFAVATWLPAFVAAQAREAWATATPPARRASRDPAEEPAGPAVPALAHDPHP